MSEIYNPHTRTWEYIPSEPPTVSTAAPETLEPAPTRPRAPPRVTPTPTLTASRCGRPAQPPPPRPSASAHGNHGAPLREPPLAVPRLLPIIHTHQTRAAGLEMQHSLSPRPNAAKRNSSGSSAGRPVMKNTRTSFTANGDRVEEYSGEGSLRIGTHWIDDQDEVAVEGLGTRAVGRRGSGYGRGSW
ncbi:uncharacterized protein H6S33_001365 [Morchella sextelata]|uniref:uncharacterized protein n=1 Tax=Morchella sextelata TaxID=1174677 RepID=UPI001D03D007|nr:uncharacterized protein H6S33_001365 [Morchella sextelata]KAH0609137.1 hypothetical protein H6S33_001365 [Morchella sextelata]